MNITAAQVNDLRKLTGAGMMDCKKALVESNGDMEQAVDYLRKKGQKVSAKRADRDATEGVVIAMEMFITTQNNETLKECYFNELMVDIYRLRKRIKILAKYGKDR